MGRLVPLDWERVRLGSSRPVSFSAQANAGSEGTPRQSRWVPTHVPAVKEGTVKRVPGRQQQAASRPPSTLPAQGMIRPHVLRLVVGSKPTTIVPSYSAMVDKQFERQDGGIYAIYVKCPLPSKVYQDMRTKAVRGAEASVVS